ncbi:hypothetical protein GCM10027074_78600 [Streptomyces deserti]
MKKMNSALLAAVGMAACFTLGVQGTANAATVSPTAHPTGCTSGKHDNGWSAKCSKSNGGHYKASVTCFPFDGGDRVVRWASHWRSSGTSYVSCPPLTQVESGGFVTKAD